MNWRMAGEFTFLAVDGHQFEVGAGYGTPVVRRAAAEPALETGGVGSIFARHQWDAGRVVTRLGARYSYVGYLADAAASGAGAGVAESGTASAGADRSMPSRPSQPTIFWSFGFPILLSIALGIAFRNRPPEPIQVVVEDGPGAQAIQDALARTSGVQSRLLPPDEAQRALHTGKAPIAVRPGLPHGVAR